MPDQDAGLIPIEQLVRIARLKLGTALDQLQNLPLEEEVTDELLACVIDVNSEIDRLVEVVRQRVDRT